MPVIELDNEAKEAIHELWCDECGSQSTILTVDGIAQCKECRHAWLAVDAMMDSFRRAAEARVHRRDDNLWKEKCFQMAETIAELGATNRKLVEEKANGR